MFCVICNQKLNPSCRMNIGCHIVISVGNPNRYYCFCNNKKIKYEILILGKQ